MVVKEQPRKRCNGRNRSCRRWGGTVVIAKTVSGDGTIRADGDDAVAAPAQGTAGTPAPDATTPGNTNRRPGNTNTHPGSNYSYGY